MTLQSSGAISLLDVQNEFGGSNPIGINEYYGVVSGVPTSGTISLSNFYGKSSFWTLNVMGTESITVTGPSAPPNRYQGITVTPGSSNSPVTFSIESSVDSAAPFGWMSPPSPSLPVTGALWLYIDGTVSVKWEYTTGGYRQFYYTATFGGSSMYFLSFLFDSTSNGSGYYNKVSVNSTQVFYDYVTWSYTRD